MALEYVVQLLVLIGMISSFKMLEDPMEISTEYDNGISNELHITIIENGCCHRKCRISQAGDDKNVSCGKCGCHCIPYEEIPNNVTSLELQNNVLESLSNGSFADFHLLKFLILSSDSIRSIESGAFGGLVNLMRLDLSHNPITTYHNFLFLPLKNLKLITFAKTSIRQFNINTLYRMPSLTKITLDHNDIILVPYFVNDKNESVVPQIDKIRFKHNSLKRLKAEFFTGLETISELNFGNNQIHTIEPKCFEHLTRLKMLNLAVNRLNEIYESSLWSPSITFLYLEESSFILNSTTQRNFESLPQLSVLRLRGCHIDFRTTDYVNCSKHSET